MSMVNEIIENIKRNNETFFKTTTLSSDDINSAYFYEGFKKYPAIYYTLSTGQIEIAELLIKQCQYLKDTHNYLYLMEATRNKACSLASLKKLVELGCNVNEVNPDGFTPIFNLAFHGDMEKIQFFIEKGADLSRVNRFRVNIISNAVFSPTFNIDALIILVKNGADYFTIDVDGESFVDSARSANMSLELINIFEKAFRKEINRKEFIHELETIKFNFKSGTSFEGEKRRLEARKISISKIQIPIRPNKVDEPELSRIYVNAMQGKYRDALVAGTVMMDNMQISALLLCIMTCCFNEIGETILFEEYRNFFLYACRQVSREREFGIILIESRIGKEKLYHMNAVNVIFQNIL